MRLVLIDIQCNLDIDAIMDAERERHTSSDSVFYTDPSYKRKVLKQSVSSIDPEEFNPEKESRVLVLYTGGTIGMKVHDGVYVPEPNYLVGELRKLPIFHDSAYHIGHGSAAEMGTMGDDRPLVMPTCSQLVKLLKEHIHVTQSSFTALPKKGAAKDKKRIIYCICEYEPLLDSSNMTINDYGRLATDIMDNYDKFDGFVVLHGTDTMSYTAAALSFMLEYLGKPVILTGSQIPIFETRSDGRDNFLGALIMAGNYCIPEVTVFFHNQLLRGNRSTKADASDFHAFWSMNMHPLAELGINIKVHWKAIFRPVRNKKFRVHTNMCPDVGVLRLFPSITAETVRAFVQPPMCGVVLQSYGAGNGPDTRADLLRILHEASQRGVLVLNITQCYRGAVSAAYAAGKALSDVGVIPGRDMTPEAALMKLSYVLGKDHWSLDKKRKVLSLNIRGEQTVDVEEEEMMELSIIDKMADTLSLSTTEEVQTLRESLYPPLVNSAARQGNLEAVKQMKKAGAVLSMGDYDHRTPLHVACCEGHSDLVRYLLDNGAVVHARDRYGHTALDDALRFQQLACVDLLRAAGAHLALPQTKLGMMLCNSVMNEDVTAMKAWVRAGANINQGDYGQRRALHLAASVGKLSMVQFLLENKADPSLQDSFGCTALDEARNNGHSNVVAAITEHIKAAATPSKA